MIFDLLQLVVTAFALVALANISANILKLNRKITEIYNHYQTNHLEK